MSVRAVAHALRQTTGLVGLKRVANPREVLSSLYEDTLAVASQMPSTAAYRQELENRVNKQIKTLNSTKTVDEFEQAMKLGLVEQIVVTAEEDLALAKKMLDWRPWEPLEEQPAPGQW